MGLHSLLACMFSTTGFWGGRPSQEGFVLQSGQAAVWYLLEVDDGTHTYIQCVGSFLFVHTEVR
jgi:hypothetical protein